VEKKIELDGPDAVAAFEELIKSKGGKLLQSLEFTDCYWDRWVRGSVRSSSWMADCHWDS
jgi:hypothetical protein